MYMENNVWFFSNIDAPVYCQLSSNVGEFKSIIIINEPSIIHIPCNNTIKCNNIELSSKSCTHRGIYIKSTNTRKYEEMSSIPWATTDMTRQLVSTFKHTIKKSLDDILNDSKDHQLTVTRVIKEVGLLILLTIFLVFISVISFFIKRMKHMVQKRLDKLERDVDDVVHRFA